MPSWALRITLVPCPQGCNKSQDTSLQENAQGERPQKQGLWCQGLVYHQTSIHGPEIKDLVNLTMSSTIFKTTLFTPHFGHSLPPSFPKPQCYLCRQNIILICWAQGCQASGLPERRATCKLNSILRVWWLFSGWQIGENNSQQVANLNLQKG